MNLLLAGPESNIRPSDAHGTNAAVSGVSTKLVIEASARSIVVTESQLAVDIDAVAVDVGVVDSVDGDARADVGNASSKSSTALDAVQAAASVDGQDEVRAGVSVKGLLDGDTAASKRVDLEGTGELVDTGGVVVVIATLGAEVAVGAAGAAGASVGVRGDGKGAAADAASGTGLGREAWVGGNPVAALEGSGSKDGGGSRESGEDGLDEHLDGSMRLIGERLLSIDQDLKLPVRESRKQDMISCRSGPSYIQVVCINGSTSVSVPIILAVCTSTYARQQHGCPDQSHSIKPAELMEYSTYYNGEASSTVV